MRKISQSFWLAIFMGAVIPACFLSAEIRAQAAPTEPSHAPALNIVKSYLQAIHARDTRSAYRQISSLDRAVRDETTYLRSQENFTGFALALAKTLAAGMEVWVIEQRLGPLKARIDVGYRLPTGDEILSQLHGWNADKLNALPPPARAALIEAWEKINNRSDRITVEGRESFDLVREKDGWKIFLDWRSRHRVVFKTSQRGPAELAVEFLRNDFLVKNEEPFQIDFKVTNRGKRDIVVRLDHLFEPRGLAANVDMIACGSLLPLRLRPQEAQEISSVYLLRGALHANTRLAIVYDFRPLRPAAPSVE